MLSSATAAYPDACQMRLAGDIADTFLVIEENLRQSIGLAQREGWTMLAYLLRMSADQLTEELAHEADARELSDPSMTSST